MKNLTLMAVMIFAGLGCAAAQSGGGDDSAVASRISALERAWNQAYKMGDSKSLDIILDEFIVLVNDDGSIQTKAEFMASVRSSGASAGSQEQQVLPESMKVRVFGKTAIATGVFRAKGVQNGKPYVRRERFVDTWMEKNGGWVCVATNATPILN
jgi:ketosteroid isomerase-like protein